jgi:hypothetical protein
MSINSPAHHCWSWSGHPPATAIHHMIANPNDLTVGHFFSQLFVQYFFISVSIDGAIDKK